MEPENHKPADMKPAPPPASAAANDTITNPAMMRPAKPEVEAELPQPSLWPVTLAFGLLLMAAGVIFSLVISAIGLAILLAAIIGWTLENRTAAIDEGKAASE